MMRADHRQNLLDQYFHNPNIEATDLGGWNGELGFPLTVPNLGLGVGDEWDHAAMGV